MKNALVIGISSEIGSSIANNWIQKGFEIIGSYRSETQLKNKLNSKIRKLLKLDIMDEESLDNFIDAYRLFSTI